MRVWSVVRTGWVLAVAVVMLFVGVALADDPGGKFGVFGASRLVSGGISPHEKAVDLTSNCGAQPYSLTCYNNTPPFTFSGVSFTPKGSLTVMGITTLSTDYNFGGADCGGGSPRFVIFGNVHNFEGYFGPPPNFINCYDGWLNTGNFASATDPTTRWVVNNGNTLMTWAQIKATYGAEVVSEVDIVLDGGWKFPKGQDLTVDNFTVNNKVMEAEDAFPHPHDHD